MENLLCALVVSQRIRRSSPPPSSPGSTHGLQDLKTAPDPDASLLGLPDTVRGFRLVVVDGPARGVEWKSKGSRCSIGSHPSNAFVVQDPTVSRFHCEIHIDGEGARIRDLESRNGTMVDGVMVIEAFLRMGSSIKLGKTVFRFEFGMENHRILLSERTKFGALVGVSPAMRGVFAWLERAAKTDVTLLLEGETGTGKSHAASSIHEASARKAGPFVAVDCGAIPLNLLESELFGHEKGSFTGATERRIGAFESAAGGTLFLDEIGELPTDLQTKLLRVLETCEVRRVGANVYRKVDVRVIAATNRQLRTEVNNGRFRADLYFRLAVLTIELPPLRQRPEDIPALIESILESLRADESATKQLRSPEFVAQVRRGAWPGNVRELRNHLARSLIFQTMAPAAAPEMSTESALQVDPTSPYATERERILVAFEREYLDGLVRVHAGKVARAADAAGLDRTYLYRLMRRHGIEP